MLKEEKALRKDIREDMKIQSSTEKWLLKRITALVRAVREDCAKVAEQGQCNIQEWSEEVLFEGNAYEEIAAAIRGKR